MEIHMNQNRTSLGSINEQLNKCTKISTNWIKRLVFPCPWFQNKAVPCVSRSRSLKHQQTVGICHDASDETVDIVRPCIVPIEVLMDFYRLLFHVLRVNAFYKDFMSFSTFSEWTCLNSFFLFFFIPRTLNPCAMLCKYISDVCPVLRSAPLGEIFILYWSKMWPTGDKVLASGHNSPPSWSTYDS